MALFALFCSKLSIDVAWEVIVPSAVAILSVKVVIASESPSTVVELGSNHAISYTGSSVVPVFTTLGWRPSIQPCVFS